MKKTILLVIFFVISAIMFAHPKFVGNREIFPPTPEQTRADSLHGFDVLNYDITIFINDQTHYIEGTVVATVVAEENLSQIQYELESLDVNEILVNGENADYTYTNGIITIFLDNIAAGEEFTTSVSYSGYPVLSNDIYHLGMIFGSNYVFTLSDPSGCRWWWPAYDHPWDKAEVDFHVTMRDDWLVACNGIRTSIVDNGDGTKTHNWEGENPMATFLPCITAANFLEINQNFNEVPIQNFVTATYYNAAVEDFSNLPFMMQVFSEKYGYYPFEKYGNAVVPMVTFGAMEHQTMTTLGVSYINGNHGGETTIAHELSHQWFGNCLTPLTWKDVWLSEGFATYSEAVYTEAWQGFEAMVNYVRNNIQNYYKNWAGSNSYTVYDPSYNNYFTPATYEKPASVLHMLRLLVGDETFFQILQTYFQTYHNQNVVTSEFQEICEQVSGLDLEQFFRQWIYEPGLPYLDYTYFLKDDETNPQIITYVKTSSNTNTDFYIKVPFRINFATSNDSVLAQSAPDEAVETISDLSGSEVSGVEFDPNSWILSRGNFFHSAEISNAYASDGIVVVFWNNFWEEVEIDGYNVYRSLQENGEFEKINSEIITQNYYQDENVTNGTTYYYKIKAVKNSVFETPFSNVVQATPLGFPMNQGILVVDETKDGNGVQGNPDDETVDEFYQNVIGQEITEYDYSQEGAPELEFLANYSTIIWHDDDISQHYISDNIEKLGSYLVAGGNLFISGWKTAAEIPENFLADFLNCQNTQLVSSWDFVGAYSPQYQDLQIDAEKLNPAFDGTLPYSCIFPNSENGIYFFDGINGSQYQDEVCALKSTPAGTFVLLGFPLYFCYENEAQSFMTQFLNEIGESSAEEETVSDYQLSISNFPNPFRNSTTIFFNISRKDSKNAKIDIFNIKGQKVKTLECINRVDAKTTESLSHIIWDGKNKNGEQVRSGIYFYKLQIGNESVIRKMILMR